MAVHLKFDNDKCKGCGLCVSVCPVHILELDANVTNLKGYSTVAVTDIDKCIACASCAKMCPDSIIEIEKD